MTVRVDIVPSRGYLPPAEHVTRAVSSEQTSGAVATIKQCGIVELTMGKLVAEASCLIG